MNTGIYIPFGKLAAFCRNRPIYKMMLFGSALREDFGPESDIDILVEFDPDAQIGDFGLVEMQDDLEHLLGRKVNLQTPDALSPDIRQEVLDTALVLYERKT